MSSILDALRQCPARAGIASPSLAVEAQGAYTGRYILALRKEKPP
jgi:hypothetical protein